MVEGLAERVTLSLVLRRIEGGVEISQPPKVTVPCTVGPAGRFSFAQFVWRYLRQHHAEIDGVLVQGYGLAALAANLAGRVNRTPTSMLVCSPVEAYYKCRRAHPSSNKPFRRRELWSLIALARLNAVFGQRYVALSRHLADVVRAHGTRRPIEIIPVYGVDTTLFAPSHEMRSAAKKRLGLPQQGFLIFFSSRVAPEKDSETLLVAIRQLLDKGHDLWLLHRSGGYRAFIQDAIRFGVAERVIATDAVHPHGQLPEDYRACDLCVQASREEGLGFSVLEALASEVPVIAAAVGGLRETIKEGTTGWTYPVGDATALAGRIEATLANRPEAMHRAATGRRMVCATYDRQLVFARLAEALERNPLTSVQPGPLSAAP